tara:strand:+ start:361 stop:2541 length:2181 start_codon:yes stop_codon:yes gene_type:complete
MAEELVMNVKSNVKSVTKETQDWAKSLEEVNEQIEIQEKVILDLDKDLIKLKAQQDAIPKGAWVAGMGKLNTKIKETSTELKLEKNALKELKGTQEEASEEVKKFTEAQKEQDAAAKDSIESFTFMGVSLGGVKAAFGKIIPTAKAMFGTIKAGIMSTGIGALLIAFGALAQYFTDTEKGASKLKEITSALGVVFGNFTDKVSDLGKMLFETFTNPKKAISDLWEAIKTNLINRVSGLIDTFKAAGKVINSVLTLDWDGVKAGAAEYGESLAQVATGVDDVFNKTKDGINSTIDAVKEFGKQTKKEVGQAIQLEKDRLALQIFEREAIVDKAETEKEMMKLRLKARDFEVFAADERLVFMREANKLAEEQLQKDLHVAREKLRFRIEENSYSKSTQENLDEEAQLRAAVFNLEKANFSERKRLKSEEQAIVKEIAAKTKQEENARIKSEKLDADALSKYKLERIKGETDEELRIRMEAAKVEIAQEVEAEKALKALRDENILADIEDLKEKALKKLEIEYETKLKELEQHANFLELKEELDKKYARETESISKTSTKEIVRSSKELSDNEVKWAEMTAKEKMNIASDTAGQLATILGEETEAGKAAAIIQATINTYKSAQASYASLAGIPVVGPVLGGIAAAAAVASGIKNVQAISSAGGGGGGGGGNLADTTADVTTETPAPQMMSGEFDLSGGIAPEPVKAFVVTDEMTSSQAQLANIRRRATI